MNKLLIFVLMISEGIASADWKDSLDSLFKRKESGVGIAWLKISPSARGIGLGNAYISAVDDPTAGWWNPGALARIEGTHFNFTHTQDFMSRQEFLGACIKRGVNAYGLTVSGLFINGMEYRNEQQDSIGEFSAFSFLMGFSYARILAPGVYFGGTLKVFSERILTYESFSWLTDFGVVYTALHNLQFGGTIVNLGRYPKFENQEVKPPRGWKIGASYKKYGCLLSIDANKYIDAVMQTGIGLEYSIASLLAVRAGYTFGIETYSFSAGLGVKWKGMKIDYAFRPYNLGLGSAHIFTLVR
ncbi:MAG: PorV/PorQ family protein [Candidatus Stahlbacteria bacterium]|nr:PorV/PorQ family protein [Candidatus Stahlbacteria bacterium]